MVTSNVASISAISSFPIREVSTTLSSPAAADASSRRRMNRYRAPTTSRRPRGRETAYRSHFAISSKEKVEIGRTAIIMVTMDVATLMGKIPAMDIPK